MRRRRQPSLADLRWESMAPEKQTYRMGTPRPRVGKQIVHIQENSQQLSLSFPLDPTSLSDSCRNVTEMEESSFNTEPTVLLQFLEMTACTLQKKAQIHAKKVHHTVLCKSIDRCTLFDGGMHFACNAWCLWRFALPPWLQKSLGPSNAKQTTTATYCHYCPSSASTISMFWRSQGRTCTNHNKQKLSALQNCQDLVPGSLQKSQRNLAQRIW